MINFKHFFIGMFILLPSGVWAAGDSGFAMAAQLLSAARNGNTRLVQNLINSGADVNYVDSTGVSVVCTAVMNNDMRAVQILQMYGADASKCDRQIKNYNTRTNPVYDSGLFSGLSSTHRLVLGVAGTGVVIAGLLWATDAFDGGNHNDSSGHGGSHSGGNSGSTDVTVSPSFTVPYSPAYLNTDGTINKNANINPDNWLTQETDNMGQADFNYIKNSDMQNYLLIAHGYNLFANGYYGQLIYRDNTTHVPLALNGVTPGVAGGVPAVIAVITQNGINPVGSLSASVDIPYASSINGPVSPEPAYKYKNFDGTCDGIDCASIEVGATANRFDLSGNGSVINTDSSVKDNNIVKIIGGWFADRDSADLFGFAPYGTLAIYRTGNNNNNFEAMYNAVNAVGYKNDVIANAKLNSNSLTQSGYDTIDSLISAVSGLSNTDAINVFENKVDTWYGAGQGDKASSVFATNTSMIINSTGAYNASIYPSGVDATFDNYAPVIYSGSGSKNFMSVVAVEHYTGTSSASSVSGYSDGISSLYGKIKLSDWQENDISYRARMCGAAGVGTNGTIDPWCFAAPGETSEYAVSAMAGAVANLRKAFSYMSNEQIFNLLALTADGPYLAKNSNGDFYTESNKDELIAWLKSKYTISTQADSLTGDVYLNKFKETFGYGLINLARATTPETGIYYYDGGNIVATDGSTYWQSVLNTNNRASSVFGGRAATIPVSFYDVLTDTDNTISLPRIWNTELSLDGQTSHGLYMGDTLAELKTRDVDNTVVIGDLKFGFARSERAYDDGMGGLDNLSLAYDSDNFGVYSEYQHYLTDGNGRFTGLANPVLTLASNAVTSGADLRMGRFSLMGRGFVGIVTTEGLLENDPIVSNLFQAAKLGDVVGAESGIGFNGEKLSLKSSFGTMHESDTVLGADFNGMMSLHGADTNYIDSVLSYKFNQDINLTLRGTFAWTHAGDMTNGIINGVSDLNANSFAAGVRFGNFDFVASMPLALTYGKMYYSYADLSVNDNNQVVIDNAGVHSLDLTPKSREYRLNASYRHKFGDWTDGALGFIYRINPNNTDEFGNESIMMMKISHRLGI